MIKNSRGYTLIAVLLVLVIFTVLSTAIIGMTVNTANNVRGEREDQSAFYIAEAGLNNTLAKINKLAKEQAEISKDELDFYNRLNVLLINNLNPDISFEGMFGEIPIANVQVSNIDSSTGEATIISIGQIGGKSRKLTRDFIIHFTAVSVTPDNPKDEISNLPGNTSGIPDGTVVFANKRLKFTEGARTYGNIGTNLPDSNSIYFNGGPVLEGSIFVPIGSESKAVNKPSSMKGIPEPLGLKDPAKLLLTEFPTYPSFHYPENVTVTDNGGYNKKEVIKDGGLFVDNWLVKEYVLNLEKNISLRIIRINENNKLKINLNGSDRIIVVDNLEVTNGHIEIIGDGKLTIMVKDVFQMGSSSTLNNEGDINKLNLFIQGSTKSKQIQLSGGQKVYGSLFAEDADIMLKAGSGFMGNIYTGGKNVSILGGVRALSTLLFAPHAHVKVAEGANITGEIFADSFEASGGAVIKFGKTSSIIGPTIPGDKPPIENEVIGESYIELREFHED